ncbi:hypothetical protein, partial [Yersinia enterocolitica]|uniref:hypothetical protein n=1 Tax=Yersinia enterocolitica TaxID=630 RepID=UPI001C0FBA6C
PWRGRFTLLPAFTLQDRVIEVCQQSEGKLRFALFVSIPTGDWLNLNHTDRSDFICAVLVEAIQWGG